MKNLIERYIKLFGDTASMPEEKEMKRMVLLKEREIYIKTRLNKSILICTGSLMNGLDDFDIVKWSGHSELKYGEENKIWNTTTDIDLLQNCPYINCIETEGEDIVNYSDSYFKFFVYSEDLNKVKTFIKDQIKKLITQ